MKHFISLFPVKSRYYLELLTRLFKEGHTVDTHAASHRARHSRCSFLSAVMNPSVAIHINAAAAAINRRPAAR